MNLLIDTLPVSVEIDGQEYAIRTDFRISIQFELLMAEEVPLIEKYTAALEMYYEEIPENISEALEAVFWFYNSDKQQQEINSRSAQGVKRSEKLYSFAYDDQYIYAAFMEQYGMDLNAVPYLHWWKFQALFHGLNSQQQFCRIMGYWAMTIPNDMSQKQKEFYREMKELYKLPVSKAAQEQTMAIEDALLNGGDLSGVL